MNHELLERVESIEDVLRRYRDTNETQGFLADEVIDALRSVGATRLFAPQSLGGEEADPVTTSHITEAIARIDPAAAWFVMVANSSRMLGARFPSALFDTLWGEDIDTIVAASGNAPFTGSVTDGGFLLNGTNGFVSGCHNARWLLSPFVCEGVARNAVVPMDSVEILDNWQVLGMRGTGSNDVRVSDLFVPDHMTGDGEGAPLGAHHQGALYQCPGRIVFATYVPVALALVDQALQEVTRLATEKIPYASRHPLRDRSIAQIKFGRALGIWRAARSYYYSSMETVWERACEGHQASTDDKADLYLAGTHAVQACADAGRLLQDIAATTALYDSSPLQRVFRDLEMLRHHGFASESRFGNIAQVKWGAPLDYPVLLR